MTGYEFWLEIAKEVIKYAFITGGGGLLVAWIMRFSKSRTERMSETFKDLLGMAELSVDQYLEKLNVITELDKETTLLRGKVRELDALGMETYRLRQGDAREIEELKAHRDGRDKQIADLESRMLALSSEVEALRVENKAAKSVIKKLLIHMAENKIDIPELNGDLEKLGDSVRGLVVKRPK